MIALALLGGCRPAAGPPPRHLVLVVLDTLRADRTSLYGYGLPTTPALERLAPASRLYLDVKAPAPWTVPTHATLFTGLLPVVHRAQWGSMRLAPEFETLAEMLTGHGFCTVGLSANPLVSDKTGLAQGFESFRVVGGPPAERSARILGRLDAALAEAAGRGCRLFVFLDFMDVHLPYNSSRYGREFGLEGPPPVRNARHKWEVSAGVAPFGPDDRRRHEAAYDAAVRALDDVVGELGALLARRGLLAETLLVLTSDHGEGLGAHPQIGHSISVWEEQLAVPLLVRFPDGRGAGERIADRRGLAELGPSLLDWLGLPRPPALAGVPALDDGGERPVLADYRSYFAESNRQVNVRVAERYPDLAPTVLHTHVLYCGPHKLVVDAGGGVRFFDLERDPHEQTDLAPRPPSALRSCRARYRDLLARGLFTPFDAADGPGQPTDVDLETLRSLGYVQ